METKESENDSTLLAISCGLSEALGYEVRLVEIEDDAEEDTPRHR